MSKLINGRTVEIIKIGLINLLNNCGDIRGESTRCLQELCPYYGDDCCEESILSGVIALIKHLEAQQPTWISVKERLPEQGSDVLIRIERDPEVVYYAAAIRNERSRLFDCWDTNDEDFNCGFGHPRVTHWMSITEPPKEENV